MKEQSKPKSKVRMKTTRNGYKIGPIQTICFILLAASVASSSKDGSGGASMTPKDPEQEPSDGEVLRAIVQSMKQYYDRRAARVTKVTRQRLRPSPLHRVTKRDEEVVCYDDLGCFRDEGPFDYLDALPVSPERIQTKFLLFTAKNPMRPVLLHYANASTLYTPYFNKTNPTKVMIHGFGSGCQKQWATEMKKALFQVGDVNVICVDWEEGATLPNYVQAAANTRLVGKQVARLIGALNTLHGTNNTGFHLIGFSLGAHVAGFAGNELRNISRITGLDPAAPLFEGYSTKARLDPSDAHFVDVIHSNGDSLLYGGLGAFEPMGHVDYYPNGGKVQAGCSNIFVGAISDLIWQQPRAADGRSLCNHRRAYKFFTDSVLSSCAFPAFSCRDYETFLRGECFPCRSGSNCGNMGYYADKSMGRGKLYLLTRDTEPFCANQFKVIIESSSGLAPTYGALELTLINWNQVNETFQVTSEWEQLVPGKPLTRVIVAHPIMTNLISAQIKYTPYKGWITSGLERWAVNRLIVIDSSGRRYSFCRREIPLSEHKPTTVHLRNEDCERLLVMQPILRPIGDDKVMTPSGAVGPTRMTVGKQGFLKKHSSGGHKGGADNTTGTVMLGPSKKMPAKQHSQMVYFQFFPVPIRSRVNFTFASDEQIREGVVYDVGPSKSGLLVRASDRRTPRYHSSHHRPAQMAANRFLPESGVRIQMSPVQRMPRKLPLDEGSGGATGLGRNIVPDISAQIVFIPSSHHQREMYIPLRIVPETKRRNGSRRALSASFHTQTSPLIPIEITSSRPLSARGLQRSIPSMR